jgi:hypothetical protein
MSGRLFVGWVGWVEVWDVYTVGGKCGLGQRHLNSKQHPLTLGLVDWQVKTSRNSNNTWFTPP